MKTIFSIIAWVLTAVAFADQPKAIYLDQVEKHGFKLEKSKLNPSIVQVTATLPVGTRSVGLIIRDSEGKILSSCALQIRENRCSAILSELILLNSSFVTPYVAQSEDEMTELYFGKTKAEQEKADRHPTAK